MKWSGYIFSPDEIDTCAGLPTHHWHVALGRISHLAGVKNLQKNLELKKYQEIKINNKLADLCMSLFNH